MNPADFTYGKKIRVMQEVLSPSALMPAVGVEGVVVREDREKGRVICDFMPPFPLAGGGKALADDEHGRVRVYFKPDEIQVQAPAMDMAGYQDGEVLGLNKDGSVVQWNANQQGMYCSGELLADYGIQNLFEHELSRVGVTPEQHRAAIEEIHKRDDPFMPD